MLYAESRVTVVAPPLVRLWNRLPKFVRVAVDAEMVLIFQPPAAD